MRVIYTALMVIGAFFCTSAKAGVIVQTWDLRPGTGNPTLAGDVFTTATFSDPTLSGVGVEDVLVDTFVMTGRLGTYDAVFINPDEFDISDIFVRFIDGSYFGVLTFISGSGTSAGTDLVNRDTGFELDYIALDTSFSLYSNRGIDRVGIWDLQATNVNLTPVPVPGSMPLMLLGLLVLFRRSIFRRD